jgi:murein DD-endopeptidase MepM/ murein hydrolase activator NlpD
MPKASNIFARWSIGASMLLGGMLGPVLFAGPAAAQTTPTPAPNPLASLLPNLLAPLAPLLNPSSQPTAPAGGSPGQPKANTGGGGGPTPAPVIPAQVEVHCGGVPAPLVFKRTAPRTTQPLIDAVAKVTPPGGSVQAMMVRAAPPFPVAGSASYRDDWGEPRHTPCPHLHQGNDIFANFGTPFVAPEGGTVARFGFESVGGNSVYFMGDDGYGIYGAHLQSFGPGLRIGAHVDAGTVLGAVGNTGDAAGGSPHLHFQLYPPGHAWGSPVDPKFWLDDMLNRAISQAGGVVPVEGFEVPLPQAAPGVNVGGLMNSVLLAGGHIISQPTVPVVLFVLLVVGTLAIAQTRTFKVAAELRRSRSQADVPAFLVGGTAGLVRQSPALGRLGRHDRKRAAIAAATQAAERPIWARGAGSMPGLVEKRAGWVTRMIVALGDTWGRLPEKMSHVSPSRSVPKMAPFIPSSNGHVTNGNGHSSNGYSHNSNGNGHSSNGTNGKVSSFQTRTKAGGTAKAASQSWSGPGGGKGSTSRPGGWTPSSLNGAGSRFAKK